MNILLSKKLNADCSYKSLALNEKVVKEHDRRRGMERRNRMERRGRKRRRAGIIINF
jgi:hypothetical protein